nr:hypothetical protein [Hassalia byssoidea]
MRGWRSKERVRGQGGQGGAGEELPIAHCPMPIAQSHSIFR